MLTCSLSFSGSALAKPLPPIPKPRLDAIPVCYDFGCKKLDTVNLPQAEWQQAASWFLPPAKTPKQELHQIKQGVQSMEILIGRHTPTHKDLALNLPLSDNWRELFPGQLDCIDEAINTTTYLRLFEQHGLLKHFEVLDAAYRQALFDQHWAAQIREKSTGNLFVVDSWFKGYGFPPSIQTGENWHNLSN